MSKELSKEIDDVTTESFESGFLRRRNISCGRQMVKIIITEKNDVSFFEKVMDAFFDHLDKNFLLAGLFRFFLALVTFSFFFSVSRVVCYLFFEI
jgi:hypothetical protein